MEAYVRATLKFLLSVHFYSIFWQTLDELEKNTAQYFHELNSIREKKIHENFQGSIRVFALRGALLN